MNLDAVVRRFPSLKVLAETVQTLRLTGTLSQAIGQVDAARQEATRSGRGFILGNNAAIAAAANMGPVQALPTTQAQWVIWNADPNRSLVFDEIGMYQFVNTSTAGVGGILLGALFSAITTPITGASTTGVAITNASLGGLVSKAIVQSPAANAITTPGAPNWYPIATDITAGARAAFPQAQEFLENRNIQGWLIVPPLQGLALAVVAPTGTNARFAPFAKWYEMELDLE